MTEDTEVKSVTANCIVVRLYANLPEKPERDAACFVEAIDRIRADNPGKRFQIVPFQYTSGRHEPSALSAIMIILDD